jgi:hypothetical protein
MTEHKARPEPWQADAARWLEAILELRARVEALEAKYKTMRLATSEQGKDVYKVKHWSDEHQQRIEALKAAQPIDEEENDRRFHACMDLIRNATPEQIRAAAGLPERKTSKVYEINEPLQLTPEQAQQVRDLLAPNFKPSPNFSQIGSSLVVRVNDAVNSQVDFSDDALECSRVAIREIAAWLREQHDADLVAATVLEREAER